MRILSGLGDDALDELLHFVVDGIYTRPRCSWAGFSVDCVDCVNLKLVGLYRPM